MRISPRQRRISPQACVYHLVSAVQQSGVRISLQAAVYHLSGCSENANKLILKAKMTSRHDILDPLPLIGSSCPTLTWLKLLIENFLGAEVLHEQNYIPELGSDDGIF